MEVLLELSVGLMIAELTVLTKLENFKEDNVHLRPSLHATDFEMLNIELIVVSYVICR